MKNTSFLNRRAETRQNPDLIDSLFSKLSSRILTVFKSNFICKDGVPHYHDLSTLGKNLNNKNVSLVEQWRESCDIEIYMGEHDERHYFILTFTELPQSLESFELLDVRTAALNSSPFDTEVLFYAQGLSNWHFNHHFCAKCGDKTFVTQSGHSRTCSSEQCKKEHFPRIEPAVIFSICTVKDNVQKILLARQQNWPDKRYSVLAGFAEHGESLEMAVEREALEEVGLKVGNTRYLSSQPWPFPASLMLGFSCETKEHAIRLVDQELEHADWFSAKEIESSVQKGELLMPYSVSISWHIIDLWYKQQTGQSLKSLS